MSETTHEIIKKPDKWISSFGDNRNTGIEGKKKLEYVY